jgi:hypothetical protein
MKINKGILKQMIAEEMATFNEKADPGKLPKDRFPTKLSQVDMDTAQRVAQAGDDDGQSEDDVIGVSKGTMPVSQLKPAQSTMKISNAMGMALAMLRGDMDAGGDLGGFISQDGHILDGHHRWVATAMVDPSKEVGGFVVDFPASQIIAVLNTITKGLLGITKGKEGSGSFAQFQEEPMRKQLQDFMQNGVPGKFPVAPEKIVAQVKQATGIDDPAQARDALVQRFAKNLAGIKFQVPAGAPERVDMPVIDPGLKKGALQIAVNALTKGLIDVNPPFAGGDEQAAPEGDEEGEQEMQESKKDMLKRIVAEEIAKMEIETIQNEGFFSRLGARFGRANKDFPIHYGEFKTVLDDAAEKMNYGDLSSSGLDALVDVVYDAYDKYKAGMMKATGEDNYGWTQELNKDQQEQHSEINKRMRRIIDKLYKEAEEQGNQEAADKARELERQRYRDMEREREEREARQRERERSSSSSSSRKSEFDKWYSDEGDNYNYMTRMESLSKQKLAKVVQEVLADMKK